MITVRIPVGQKRHRLGRGNVHKAATNCRNHHINLNLFAPDVLRIHMPSHVFLSSYFFLFFSFFLSVCLCVVWTSIRFPVKFKHLRNCLILLFGGFTLIWRRWFTSNSIASWNWDKRKRQLNTIATDRFRLPLRHYVLISNANAN